MCCHKCVDSLSKANNLKVNIFQGFQTTCRKAEAGWQVTSGFIAGTKILMSFTQCTDIPKLLPSPLAYVCRSTAPSTFCLWMDPQIVVVGVETVDTNKGGILFGHLADILCPCSWSWLSDSPKTQMKRIQLLDCENILVWLSLLQFFLHLY